MVKKIYIHIMGESLYRNSLFLMGSTMVTAMFGFLFWILCARLFQTNEIGIATTIISATALITQFSLLGMKNGLIRFLPNATKKNIYVNTSYTIVILCTLVLSVLYIVFLPFLSEKLMFLRYNILYVVLFILFVISFSLNQIQEGIFIAQRSTGYLFLKSLIWGAVKISLPLVFVLFGAFGIFTAFSLGSVLACLFGLFILLRKFHFRIEPALNIAYVKRVGKFALGDYMGIFLGELPYFILPLFIINMIGTSQSAFYYIDMQIATFLYMIPVAVTQSLFAEGSFDETKLKLLIRKAAFFMAIIIIPSIIATLFLSSFVLGVFGLAYQTNGILLLRILAIGSLFMSVISLGNAVLHIEKKNHIYVVMNLASALLILGVSYILIPYGLAGIGYAFLIEQVLLSLIYLFILWKAVR